MPTISINSVSFPVLFHVFILISYFSLLSLSYDNIVIIIMPILLLSTLVISNYLCIIVLDKAASVYSIDANFLRFILYCSTC